MAKTPKRRTRRRGGSCYHLLDLSGVKRHSIQSLARKVSNRDLAVLTQPAEALKQFIDNLPGVLIGKDFREFVQEVASRHADGQHLLLMVGGHIIKCGLAPLILDLMQRGYVSALATNGAGAIHDVEMALFERTSEDVAEGLRDGSFGMVSETGDFFNDTLHACAENGYGEALGRRLLEHGPGNGSVSLLAAGYELKIPVTVHVAIGTDIVHQHPAVRAAELGGSHLQRFPHSVRSSQSNGERWHRG